MAEQQNIQDIPQDHNQDVPDEATQFQPIPVPDMLGQEPPVYPAHPPPPPPPVDLAAFLQNYLTQQAGQQAQLQQTLELLTQVQHAQLQGQFQQQAQQQIGGSRSLKIKEPRTFTGKREELIPFTSELRNAITLQRGALITDNDKALYMNAFLKKPGPPDSWWNGISKSHPELLHDFEGLLKNFTEHFEDPDLRATKQRELDSLEQKGSASNYAARFLELCTYLDLTDTTKQDYFVGVLWYNAGSTRCLDNMISFLMHIPYIIENFVKIYKPSCMHPHRYYHSAEVCKSLVMLFILFLTYVFSLYY